MDPHWREKYDALNSERDALYAQIATLTEFAAAKTRAMAALIPIQQLPDEVLVLIFEEAYRHDFPRCRYFSGALADSPVVTTHVCRRWRRVALALPSIWACQHVTLDQPKGHLAALRAFIERSGQRPLGVVFVAHSVELLAQYHKDWAETNGPWDDFKRKHWPRLHACWTLLLEEHRRWKQCVVYTPLYMAMQAIQKSLCGHDFPKLEFLDLTVQRFKMPSVYEDDWSWDVMDMKAPALKTLRSFQMSTTLYPLSLFNTLTDLALDEDSNTRMRPQTFFDILRHAAPTLEVLALGRVIGYGITSASQPIPWRRLRTCYIRNMHGFRMAPAPPGEHSLTFLHVLLSDAPSLETLRFYNDEQLLEHLGAEPLHLPNVRILKYCGHSMSSTVDSEIPLKRKKVPMKIWKNLIESFPGVEIVSLRDWDMLPLIDVLKKAGDRSSDAPAWPHLQSLSVVVDRKENREKLLSFLAFRHRIQHPIHELHIIDAFPQPGGFELVLQMLRSVQLAKIKRLSKDSAVVDHLMPWSRSRDRPRLTPWNGLVDIQDQY